MPGIVPLKVAEPLPLAKMVKTLYEELRSTTESASSAPVIEVLSAEVLERPETQASSFQYFLS